MCLRLAHGAYIASSLRRSSAPADWDTLQMVIDSMESRLGLKLPPVRLQDGIIGPVVLGVLRPMILIPATALTGLSAKELEMVLLHELAHVRRLDLPVQALQRVCETLLYYHPAVWHLSGRISLLREHCCDSYACMHATGNSSTTRYEYSQMLLRLAEIARSTANGRTGSLYTLSMGADSKSMLHRRVEAFLGVGDREANALRPMLAIILAVAVFAVLLPSLRPVVVQAQVPPTAAEDRGQSAETQVISGRVCDVNGNGIDNVIVVWELTSKSKHYVNLLRDSFSRRRTVQSASNAAGNFEVSVPKEDRSDNFAIWFLADGFEMQCVETPDQLDLITLQKAESQSITIRQPNGSPATGVKVSPGSLKPKQEGGRARSIPSVLSERLQVISDNGGRVQLPNVALSEVLVATMHSKEFGNQPAQWKPEVTLNSVVPFKGSFLAQTLPN